MYQVGGVVGNILIGYLSDQFLIQVTCHVHRVILLSEYLQDGNKMFEHSRAPALFLISVLLLAVLYMFNFTVKPGVSEVGIT